MLRRISFAAAATLLFGSLQSAPAVADDGSIEVVNMIYTEIPVTSNGSAYDDLPPISAIQGYVRIKLDAGLSGKIKWVTAWWAFGDPDVTVNFWTSYREDGYHKSFDPRPKTWEDTVLVGVPIASFKDQALKECNDLADRLRDQGLSDQEIFSKDRIVEMAVTPGFDYEMSGLDDNDFEEASFDVTPINLVCKKWPGATPSFAVEPPFVEQASLSVIEQQGLTMGRCKINLSGVIETSQPDVAVSFRYKDNKGNESGVHSVETDSIGLAMFSHDYDVPINEQGPETGKVRMVGVSHDFASTWSDYEMDCTGIRFEALLPPKLTMQVIPREHAMVGRQHCPTEVKIVGKIEGRSEMSGEAIFVGDDHYLSPKRAYEVQKGDVELIGADRELDWTQADLVLAGQVRKLTIQLGFNVTGPSNTIVASLPKKPYTFSCRILDIDVQAGQGGFGAAPRPNPAPSKSPQLRLAPQAAPGTAPGAATPTAPRQPAPRLSPREPEAPQLRLQRQRLRLQD